jgi:hypothetical protein
MRLTIYGVTAALLAIFAGTSFAQTKTVTGETQVVTATIESIDHATRTVNVKKSDGTYDDFYVPTDVKKFNSLKIGDTVTARYYENIVLRVQAAGEKAVDTSSSALTLGKGDKMAGTLAHQRTITATISAIDMKVPSITFTGSNGWKYSRRVEDVKALATVKVGDKVDITWTEAALLSIDTASSGK